MFLFFVFSLIIPFLMFFSYVGPEGCGHNEHFERKKSPKSILNVLQKQNLSNIVFMVSKFGKYF